MKKTGLVGYPLGHSISPAMHNAAFDFLGIKGRYDLFETTKEDLETLINSLKNKEFLGFNVTVPYKEEVIEFLDEITPLASLIGAVNTVKNEDGKLVGYNTDGPGFVESLKDDAGFSIKDKTAIVLGAGGAGKAVAVMLAENESKKIIITDIDIKKAQELASHIKSKLSKETVAISPKEVKNHIKDADLIVNSSPIGMHPKTENSPIDDDVEIPSSTLVYDLVYNPHETKLIKQAKLSGAKTCSGLGMLIRQGALAFSIFTDTDAPLEIMWDAAKKALH